VIRRTIISTYRGAKRIVTIIIGGTVLLVGIILIVLPGPAILVIPLGLAILGLEFSWARRWLQEIRNKASFRNNSRE